eukprot:scaffold237_cov146-Skeletonema_menzelii.AAC.7
MLKSTRSSDFKYYHSLTMKLTSIIILGLGMTALASGDANLRANAPSRQLRNSQQASGGTWMYYLMLNCLAAPADVVGLGCGKSECNNSTSTSSGSGRELWGSDGYSTSSSSSSSAGTSAWSDDAHSSSSSSKSSSTSTSSSCPVRCHKAPHLKPPHLPHPHKPKTKKHSGGSSGKKSGSSGSGNKWSSGTSSGSNYNTDGSSSTTTWGDDGYKSDSSGYGDDENGEKSENGWYNDDAGNYGGGSDENYGENAEEEENSGDDAYVGSDDSEKNQYLSNSNGKGGNAVQINSGKSMPVWPFLVAALAVGVVAAALIANRRKKARRGNHALNGSIKRRMELFSGGLPRKEKPAAESSLYENDYENEPSFVEMEDSRKQEPVEGSLDYENPSFAEMRDPDNR